MKRVVALLAGGMMVLVLSGPAVAQTAPYPPTGGSISGSATAVAPGGSLTVSVTACPANSTVPVTLNGNTVASITTDASGAGSASVKIPSGTPSGATQLVGTCGGVAHVLALTIVAPSTGALPFTGRDVLGLIALAVIFGGLGAAALMFGRRRSASH
jgi:hypothetical protein